MQPRKKQKTKDYRVGANEKVQNQKTVVLTREKRLGTKTRKVYRSKILHIMGYLKDNGFQSVLQKKEIPDLIGEVDDDGEDVDDDDEGVLLEHEDVEDLDINLDLINWTHLGEVFGNITKGGVGLLTLEAEVGTAAYVEYVATHNIFAAETVSGYASAFKSLYKDNKKQIPADLNLEIDQTIEGYKKTIAELKKNGRYQLTEGKKHIRYTGFEELVKMFFLKFKPTSIISYFCKSFSSGLFAALFIVLMMVTMQRSDNIESLNLANIGWFGDYSPLTSTLTM